MYVTTASPAHPCCLKRVANVIRLSSIFVTISNLTRKTTWKIRLWYIGHGNNDRKLEIFWHRAGKRQELEARDSA